MLRRLRCEPAGPVVDPDEEAAIGRGQDVEVAVAIDVRRHDPLQLHVVARGDRSRERGHVNRGIDAHDGAVGHRRRARRRRDR